MYAWQATVQDGFGNAVSLPVLTVYEDDGVTLANIYDETGAAESNPLTGSISGFVKFFAVEGRYVLSATDGGNFSEQWTVDVVGPVSRTNQEAKDGIADGNFIPQEGSTYVIGGFNYLGKVGSTIVPDLDNLSPVGVIYPEQFGAKSGFLLHPETRLVFDDIIATYTVRNAYLWLLERTVRRFIRAGIWSGVTYSIGVGGLITWSSVGLDARELRAYNYINASYSTETSGIVSLGEVVTATFLNESNAIDATVNTSALQSWLDALSETGQKGVLAAADYPINATLRARYNVTFEGVNNRSRFRMDASVGYNHPVFHTGDTDEPAKNIVILGFPIFDGYYDQREPSGAGSTGLPTNTDILGSCVSIAYTSEAFIEAETWDARKHCFSTDGGTNSRSGTPYVYPTYTQKCHNLTLNVRSEGAGDDLFTTHQSENVLVKNVFSLFARGTITSNGNGCEIDDGSKNVLVQNVVANFCYGTVEIKGHDDAVPATGVWVERFYSTNCTNGIVFRHVGHGDTAEPESPFYNQAGVGSIEIRDPLAWTLGTERYGLRAYAYNSITVLSASAYQGESAADYYGTDSAVSDGIWQAINGQKHLKIGSTYVEGFRDSVAAVRITSSTIGPIFIDSTTTVDGPLRGVSHTGGARLYIDSSDLNRSLDVGVPTVGSIGIRGSGDLTQIGRLKAFGFENNITLTTSVFNEVGRLLTSADNLDNIGDLSTGEGHSFNRRYVCATASVPSGVPLGVNTFQMDHIQRSSESRSQIIYRSGSRANEVYTRGYTLGAWEPWYKTDQTSELGSVVVTTDNYTLLPTDRYIKINRASNTTIILPSASTELGRRLEIATQQGRAVISNSANVVQSDSGAAGTLVIPPYAGANCVLVSNGTNWVVTSASHVSGFTARIGQVNTTVSHTGSTSPVTLGTIVVPGGAMGANGELVINGNASLTNDASSKTFRIKINGTTVVSITSVLASQSSLRFNFAVNNRNSVSSQIATGTSAFSGVSGGGVSTIANAFYTFDTTIDMTITVECELGDSADTFSLDGWQVLATYTN